MKSPNVLILQIFLTVFAALGPDLSVSQTSEEVQFWPKGALRLDTPIPDLSALNHRPAGIHGKIQAVKDELFFEDGTPARFWGANLQAYALFSTEPKFISAHAKRLARLGFNLVRIHHHDSHWVQPNIFGSESTTTRQLDPKSLKKLDQWIAALKAQGIYVWLDLHVGRRFTAKDGVKNFAELAMGEDSADIRGFNYISPSTETLMREFQETYLQHVNKITGLSYAEDPAVIALMITNENDLTHHFGNALLPNKDVPTFSSKYMKIANEFATEHDLDPDSTWRSWEHGPSKIFLSDLERQFNDRMIASISATGFEGLITTTSLWAGMSIAGIPSLTRGSLIDAHSYGAPGETLFDPRTQPSFLDWMAIAQVPGMPLSISEWNIGDFPAEDRFVAPLRIAALAAHQGWDAPIVYGYSQQPLNQPLSPSNWSIAEDPSMISMMPAAALLFRQGHVRLAERTFALCPDHEEFFGRHITPSTSIGIRTIVEQSRLVTCMPDTPALPWLQATILEDHEFDVLKLDRSYLPEDAHEIVADTGDFHRDFGVGLFVVDTAKSQAAAGWFSDTEVSTANVTFDVDNPTAAIAVQSLDGTELSHSRHILVSVSARASPEDVFFRVEPLKGQIHIKAQPDLRLVLPNKKTHVGEDFHTFENGRHTIDLGKLGGENWFYLK